MLPSRKPLLYCTAAVWLGIGLALYWQVSFVSEAANAVTGLLAGGLLVALAFIGVHRLAARRNWPRWLTWAARLLAAAGAALAATVWLAVAVLGSALSLQAGSETLELASGLVCEVETVGGATTSVDRQNVTIYLPLHLGLHKALTRSSRLLNEPEALSAEGACHRTVLQLQR